jgi:hypothetical protein
LTDPQGKTSGFGTVDSQIPNSRYGNTIELPNSPNMSKVLAVEVCQPSQGVYTVTIEERAIGRYRLAVTATGEDTANTEVLRLAAQEGRTRDYKFKYALKNGNSTVRFVQNDGKLLSPLELFQLDEW